METSGGCNKFTHPNILQSLESNEISHITFIKQFEMPEQTKQWPFFFFFFKSPHVVLLEKGKSDNQVAFSS